MTQHINTYPSNFTKSKVLVHDFTLD